MHDKAVGTQTALYPCVSHSGIEVMSINLLLEDETDPVIWRGPVIGGVVQQFWTDVAWDVDYLFVDMPPAAKNSVRYKKYLLRMSLFSMQDLPVVSFVPSSV